MILSEGVLRRLIARFDHLEWTRENSAECSRQATEMGTEVERQERLSPTRRRTDARKQNGWCCFVVVVVVVSLALHSLY